MADQVVGRFPRSEQVAGFGINDDREFGYARIILQQLGHCISGGHPAESKPSQITANPIAEGFKRCQNKYISLVREYKS
jgi:hypothetical protein